MAGHEVFFEMRGGTLSHMIFGSVWCVEGALQCSKGLWNLLPAFGDFLCRNSRDVRLTRGWNDSTGINASHILPPNELIVNLKTRGDVNYTYPVPSRDGAGRSHSQISSYLCAFWLHTYSFIALCNLSSYHDNPHLQALCNINSRTI